MLSSCWGSFTKGINPIHEDSPSLPNHLPKAPSPHTITLRKQFQHINGGGGHTHSVYSSLFKKTRLEVRLLFLKLKLDDKLKLERVHSLQPHQRDILAQLSDILSINRIKVNIQYLCLSKTRSSKNPSRSLKLWIVLNPILLGFSCTYIHIINFNL